MSILKCIHRFSKIRITKRNCRTFSFGIQSRFSFKIQRRFFSEERGQLNVSPNAKKCMSLESKYGANNYHPIPCVISRGQDVKVWDVDGNEYLDFLAAYGAVNQGHNHPKIVSTMNEQLEKITLTSRAFHNDLLGEYCEFVAGYFNYKRVLPMNTGVEACESAIKIARKWGYQVKGIKENEARVCFVDNNFWGRSIAAVTASTDPESYTNYGPFVPLFDQIEYNNVDALAEYFEKHGESTCAFMVEPIQGEAGVVIPDDDYLIEVRDLCREHNVLFICDEVQAGMGRCGSLLGINHEIAFKDHLTDGPDLITLGKAISGGVYPVSCVLSRTDEIMDVLTPGTHGSTYGGNPLGCKVAMTAMNVLKEEGMVENSAKMGELLCDGLEEIEKDFFDEMHVFDSVVKTTRGRGLFAGIEIFQNEKKGLDAWKVCIEMMKRGVLCKPTHENIIRLSPPLTVNEWHIERCLDALRSSFKAFQ